MSSSPPPTYVVNIYNPAYFTSSTTGLTQAQANALYLQKGTPDTATALESFTGGITTNTINPVSSSITIGDTAATASVTIRNPIMSLSYTTYPSYTSSQIGYTTMVSLNTAGGNLVTISGNQVIALTLSSVPAGLWMASYQTRITATSTTVGTTITNYETFINVNNQASSIPYSYGAQGFGTTSIPVGAYTSTGLNTSLSTSGCSTIKTTTSASFYLIYTCLAAASVSFWNDTVPTNYLMITRIG